MWLNLKNWSFFCQLICIKMPIITRSKTAQQMTSIKLDLSKMPKKPVSAPFVIAKSTEQQLADALVENEKFRETVNAQKDEIEVLKKELANQMKHARMDLQGFGEALAMIDVLMKENDTLKAK